MAEVLVLAEHAGGEVKKVTCELLTLARAEVAWIAMQKSIKWSRHLGRLATQFVFDGGGEEEGIGVLWHVGGAGIGIDRAALRAKQSCDEL